MPSDGGWMLPIALLIWFWCPRGTRAIGHPDALCDPLVAFPVRDCVELTVCHILGGCGRRCCHIVCDVNTVFSKRFCRGRRLRCLCCCCRRPTKIVRDYDPRICACYSRWLSRRRCRGCRRLCRRCWLCLVLGFRDAV